MLQLALARQQLVMLLARPVARLATDATACRRLAPHMLPPIPHLLRCPAFCALQVLQDGGSLKTRLDENRFFSKPRLGLDAVGGSSASRIAECLQEGCPLVVYGCMSGKSPQFQWSSYIFRDLQARCDRMGAVVLTCFVIVPCLREPPSAAWVLGGGGGSSGE